MKDERKERAERLAGRICDRYCLFPRVCTSQEKLDTVCKACPINELINMAKGENTNEGITS